MSKRFEELLLRTEAELLSRQLLAETPRYARDELLIAQLEMAFVEGAQNKQFRGRRAAPRPESSSRRLAGLLVRRLIRS